MSKRTAEFQGGGERYGAQDNQSDMADKPQRATAAQMAKRTIAQARKPSGSQRSSRAGTPTAFGQQQSGQQSMPSFQPPEQSGTGFGGGFNFSVNSGSNPFANFGQTNGASSTPPPTFNFGDTSSQTQQNGGGMFGNSSTSFGSTFGAGSSQPPQQNGFNPSITSMFGQNQTDSSKTNTSSVFAGFGQNNASQSQQNGLTPSTNNSFPSFGNQNENPFKGFGQSQQQQTQSTANTSFNSLNQNAQTNGEKTPSTPFVFGQNASQTEPSATKSLFGATSEAEQTPKSTTSSIFPGFGQQKQANGDKPLFPSTAQTDQTLKSTSSNVFGGQPNNALGLFGSTPPPESGTSTPKPGESIFGSLNQSKSNGISADMFTKSRDQTPNPTTSNPFGQPPQTSSTEATEQTPKPANIFGQLNQSQPNGDKPSLFGSTSRSRPEQQTPKPSLFGGTSGKQQQTQSSEQSAPPVFKFGQPAQDTSMTTPGNTPQKPTDASLQQAAPAASSSTAPTAQSGGLFGRTTSSGDAPSIAQTPLFQPSTSLFNPQTSTAPDTSTQPQQTPNAQGTSLFSKPTPSDAPATAFKPSFTPSTNIMNKQPVDKTAAPWLSHAPSAPTEPAVQQPSTAVTFASSRPATSTTAVVEIIPDDQKKTLKVLNEGLKQHLARQDVNADWTPIMRYYMKQAAQIRKKPEPKFDAPSVVQNSAGNGTGSTNIQQKPAQTPASAASSSTNGFSSSATPQASAPIFQQTPKPSGATSLLQPPQTAPVNNKRSAVNDAPQQPPATEQRSRSNEPTAYPKLPDNASETAKLFQAALNKSTSSAAPSLFNTGAEAKEKADKEKETQAPNAGGFKPSTTGFTPSNAGFKPSGGSAGGSFLASFGGKAKEQEEKERRKRKAEEYDSDEDTEEAWAERDRVEQQAKRQRIMDAAKIGSGFTPTSSAAGTPAPESDIGEGSDRGSERGDDTDTEAPAGQAKSLFDRITPRESPVPGATKPSLFSAQPSDAPRSTANLFAPKTPSGLGTSSMTTSNIFSQLSTPRKSIEIADDGDKAEAEKEQGTGDNTWKPNTPIKFGGSSSAAAASTTPAAAPPFGSLFGNLNKSNADSNAHLSVPKATLGFNFGGQPPSVATSRASTPGFTTDGEGASTAGEDNAEEEEHAPAEPQVEDQTGLRESEKENEDLLFSVHMAKAMKWGEKKNDAGEIVWGWVDKGKGPVYILKHKETGKVRIVLKVPPYGTPRMNFEPLKNVEYEVPKGGSGKMVQGIFVDHLDEKVKADGNKAGLSKWLVQVGKKEDAQELAKVLMENRAK